jgi:predicted DCC family thiol-disulfide oxidoreductase YuxK
LNREEVTRVLHGVKPDGTVIKGMEAVRQAYEAVGLGWVLAPTRLPGLRRLSDLFYGWFARNRLALGRLLGPTCSNGHCAVTSACQTRRR